MPGGFYLLRISRHAGIFPQLRGDVRTISGADLTPAVGSLIPGRSRARPRHCCSRDGSGRSGLSDGPVRPVTGTLGAVIAPTPFSSHPEGTLVEVWVVPGARRTEVVGWHDGAVRVRVAAAAEGDKANRALLAVLRQTTEARRARLIRGATSRRKRVLLEGTTTAEVAGLLTK